MSGQDFQTYLASVAEAIEEYVKEERAHFNSHFRPTASNPSPKPFPDYKETVLFEHELAVYTFFGLQQPHAYLHIVASNPLPPLISCTLGKPDPNGNSMLTYALAPGLLSVLIHHFQSQGIKPEIPYPQED